MTLATQKKIDVSPASEELLDSVYSPESIRHFSESELTRLSDEVRKKTITSVAKTGGHLGASLGVVELTVALHAVFNTPTDKLIWDVGHQSYPHKILTGRKDLMHTLRQGDGISGFTKRDESEYDPFGAGHSSTSISAGLGMAAARDLSGDNNNVICVIGDGALGGGMAFEAMNHAGELGKKLIVILNDNKMSISPPVGAMSRYLTKLVSSSHYTGARETAKSLTGRLPDPLREAARIAEETARASLGRGTLFEEMGFYYIGPVNGHSIPDLTKILGNVRDIPRKGPVLIHCHTIKGKGYAPAERANDKMHGVAKFNLITGTQTKPDIFAPTYTKVFADTLSENARKDDKIVGITAAMPAGTGMDIFEKEFPDRMFDTGIAEQHAVTFAAGMAAEGYKPFVAVYSTFLQRAYDQIIHDVALQKLPVRFAIDRAGLVGEDGSTHAGAFDTAFLACIPDIVLMAASDEAELARMVNTAASYNKGPIAFRYPRGCGTGTKLPQNGEIIEIGKGRIVHESKYENKDIAILSYGARLSETLKAAKILEKKGLSVTIADARFAKPFDKDLVTHLATTHKKLLTVEEGSIGGFGSLILNFLNEQNLIGENLKVKTLTLPDSFQRQNSTEKQYEEAGLSARKIANSAL